MVIQWSHLNKHIKWSVLKLRKPKTSYRSLAVDVALMSREHLQFFKDDTAFGLFGFFSHKSNPFSPFCPLSPIGLITLEELHQQVLKGRGKFAQDVSQ